MTHSKRSRTTVLAGTMLALIAALSCSARQTGKHEVRAVWMSRFDYAEKKSPTESRDYITAELERCRKAGINTVIFQVRGNADALYRSTLEPWSALLSGSLGKDPGWDPLEFAIAAAHQRGMELHAWINVYPAWKAGTPLPPATSPLHPLLAHPEWVVRDVRGEPMNPKEGYITFNPASPGVRAHVIAVVEEIVGSYDIDGIHLDYIRYPDGAAKYGYSSDSDSLRQFSSSEGNPLQLNWGSWQREQVNLLVAEVYNRVTGLKPWVKVSAAAIGHISGTSWNGYHAVYQDAQRWLSMGKIDMIFPMTYTSTSTAAAPYRAAIRQWEAMLHYGRIIVPAVPVYKYGQKSYDLAEFNRQIRLIRGGSFQGVVFFSATGFAKVADSIGARHFTDPALPVPMFWKHADPPVAPRPLAANRKVDYTIVRWETAVRPALFALYDADKTGRMALIAVLPGYQTFCIVSKRQARKGVFVTAVNRIGMESEPVLLQSNE
jgi:uncharacterized lipoprotein YddW (UPF0748 family)